MNLEEVEKSVVKIECIPNEEDEDIILGTGFFIDTNIVVTSGHVIDEYYTDDYNISIITYNGKKIKAKPLNSCKEGDLITILKLEEEIEEIHTLLFTKNYEINRADKFLIFGYPKVKIDGGHVQDGEVSRKRQNIKSNADLELKLDSSSRLPSYNGYSGSPFIINGMLVGVVQEQSIINGQALSIGVSSFDMTKQFIPEKYLIEDKHKKKLKDGVIEYTKSQINKNIETKKYIPEIFVENGNLKEKCRLMTDPILFYEKILEDIERYKFRGLNRILTILGLNKFTIDIDFDLKKNVNLYNVRDKSYQIKLLLESKKNELEILRKSLNPDNFNYNKKDYIYNIKSGLSDEWVIKDWIDLVDILNYRSLLITEHAGQGKTNFICDLTKNVLLNKSIDTLYINAVDLSFDSIELSLERIILDRLGYNFNSFIFNIEKITKEKNKPFVLVIDGLNENANINKFSQNLELFIERIKDYEFIRVVMTCRVELFDERFNNLKKYYNSYLKNIDTLRIVNDVFEERIYYGYLSHFGLSGSQIDEFAMNKLVNNTLLLRIFCETYRDKVLPPINDICIFDLFEEYWEVKIYQISQRYSLDKLIFEKLLDKILDYMISNQLYNKVEISALDLTTEELDLLKKLLDEDILFRKDEKVKKGLREITVYIISFVFDEFRDYALANFVMLHFDDYERKEYISLIKDITNKDNEVSEGISKYLFFESKKIKNDEFDEILRSQEWYMKVYTDNIFSVNDDYITQEDINIILTGIRSDISLGSYTIDNLLNRYDENVFKNLGISLLIDTIKNFNDEEYNDYIVPIAESYINKGDNFIISNYDVKVNSRKHSIFKFIVTILDTDYHRYLDIYIEYTREYLEKSIENLKYFLDSNNTIIINNIREIIRAIKREDILTNELNKSIKDNIEYIETSLP
ncbi:V8-like Glu-specific endopeptidase [[Clostridium] sordellii]|uniref:S1 family peptidase n=1 Tax=Paraclostridium sordellii TaxID=1505 RepID=UPI0005E9495C|nr:serine protease [Paeniclostridium sordellii]CEP99113.1 V8-like Glu-specific endopeptidase [[Clostridium] sordellii] [Paeniclostridium sordellii]